MVKKVKKRSLYLLVAKWYCHATATFPKITLEYSKPFFSFPNKTYIVNVNFTESAKTIFSFPFLILFLIVFKL